MDTLPQWAIDQIAKKSDGPQLIALIFDPMTPMEAREIYLMEFHQRVDVIIAESEGRIPHPNQGVHDMLRKKFKGDRPGPTAPVVNGNKHITDPGRWKGGTLMGFKFKANPPPLAEGVYPAVLAGIEEGESELGPYLQWKFHVGHDGTTQEISGVSSQRAGPKAKSPQWIAAVLGRPLVENEELDLDTLVGHSCQLLLSVKILEDGSKVNRVEKVLKAATSTPSVPVTPFDEEEAK